MVGLRFAVVFAVSFPTLARATDWPTYRADASRSGFTRDTAPDKLQLRWTYHTAHAPIPAWPTRNRLSFDRAFHPIIAQGTLYFGSSVDDKVYALDADSGKQRWSFFANAPIRFAPVAWRDRLFVASDDGALYCLSAGDGQVIWKRQGGPRADMLLGNDRMISRWPARGGPAIVDEIVYFGAGIWPTEGIFLYALDAMSGDILWKNDSSGSLEMDQPHSNARAQSGLSSQGYLAVAGETLLVPTGRAVPALLNRTDGSLRHFRLQMHQHAGGADVVAFDAFFANGGTLYATADGSRVGSIGLHTAVHPKYFIHATSDRIIGLDRSRLIVKRETVDRKGNKQQVSRLTSSAWEIETTFDADPASPIPDDLRPPEVRMNSTAWTTPIPEGQPAALIVGGDRVIVGGRGRVSVVDIPSRTLIWSANVDGTAYGLALVDDRLFVSTDLGIFYCFDGSEAVTATTIVSQKTMPRLDAESSCARAAEQILKRSGVSDGCCIDLGCGEGRLALALARQSDLRIYAADPDPENVKKARDLLDQAGLYGTRVTVHQMDSTRTRYAEYCADLVVCGRSVTERPSDANWMSEARRLQRPYGGIVCSGASDTLELQKRGPLPMAGSWTHQNSSPANTLCSDDRRLRGPLEVLWFRDTDFLMPNRHGRAPAPLIQNGRMFVEGLNGLRAQSIYTGRVLWEFSMPGILASYNREHSIGAAWTGGNICLGDKRVFIHDGETCFVLDAATGKEVSRISPPLRPDGKPGVWGYLAYHDGSLFGSLANEDYLIKCWSDRWDTSEQFTESIFFFALDAATGKTLWTFTPRHSIRHNAIAIGGGRIYLIDRQVAVEDDLRYVAPSKPKSGRDKSATANGLEASDGRQLHPMGRLVALNEQTGKTVWENDTEIFGTALAYVAKHDLVWMGYQAAHQASRPSEHANRMAAIDAADGRMQWDVKTEYADRPVLNDDTIYAPPGAWNMVTGDRLAFTLERSYGCGTVAGCRSMLVFRSATLGYIDLAKSDETHNYGGIRPGCWIAGIPAGGVLVMPDAASWCTCSYLNQGTIALRPSTDRVERASTE